MTSKRVKNKGRRRQHVYKRSKDTGNRAFHGRHHCPECGKWCYGDRGEAETAARILHPGATVHFYLCAGWWHFTSMTADQVAGIRSRGHDEGDEDWPEEIAV
jgi:hypothetical protein